jgi:GNAT superfamily N-acetyltransferase
MNTIQSSTETKSNNETAPDDPAPDEPDSMPEILVPVMKTPAPVTEIPAPSPAAAAPLSVSVRLATPADARYALLIAAEMKASAIARGTGIAHRSAASIIQKMDSGHAVIALSREGRWAGFSYIESWQDGKFVSNSGMIVSPAFRGQGVASAVKNRIFQLSRELYPQADIFSITTGLAIMKMNSALGFVPVPFSEITNDRGFWEKCRHCVNFDILQRKEYKNCLCTAMLYEAGKS